MADPIAIPALTSNDTHVCVVAWKVQDGEEVRKGQLLAVLETSKAAFDLEAESPGIVQRVVAEGGEHEVGHVIAYLFASEAERSVFLTAQEPLTPRPKSQFQLTDPARAFAAEHGIGEAELARLGKRLIRRSDLETFVKPTSEGIRSSLHQRGVARVVSLSHQSIPAAFSVAKVYCDGALRYLRALAASGGGAEPGLVEYLIYLLARMRPGYPKFFGHAVGGDRFVPAATSDVAVTVDLGDGLFLPVIRDAESKELREIGNELLAHRVRASRRKFGPEHMEGAAISVSVTRGRGILFAQPLIHPPQVCMVSLGSLQQELCEVDGAYGCTAYLLVGAAYDHRFINGSDTAMLLDDLKRRIEEPR